MPPLAQFSIFDALQLSDVDIAGVRATPLTGNELLLAADLFAVADTMIEIKPPAQLRDAAVAGTIAVPEDPEHSALPVNGRGRGYDTAMSRNVDIVRLHAPDSLRSRDMIDPLAVALADGDAVAAWPHWQSLLAQVAPQAEPALVRMHFTNVAGEQTERIELSSLVTDLGAAGDQVLTRGANGDGRVDWPDSTAGNIQVTGGWLQLPGKITLAEVAAQRSLLLCSTERVTELDQLIVGAAYRFNLPDPDAGYPATTFAIAAVLAARTLAEGTPSFYTTDDWENDDCHAVATISAPSSPTYHACPVTLGDLLLTG